jgi:hypothetical protein
VKFWLLAPEHFAWESKEKLVAPPVSTQSPVLTSLMVTTDADVAAAADVVVVAVELETGATGRPFLALISDPAAVAAAE